MLGKMDKWRISQKLEGFNKMVEENEKWGLLEFSRLDSVACFVNNFLLRCRNYTKFISKQPWDNFLESLGFKKFQIMD
jgi:hypothetical protein